MSSRKSKSRDQKSGSKMRNRMDKLKADHSDRRTYMSIKQKIRTIRHSELTRHMSRQDRRNRETTC